MNKKKAEKWHFLIIFLLIRIKCMFDVSDI